MLVKLQGRTTELVVKALAEKIQALPEALRRTLTCFGERGLQDFSATGGAAAHADVGSGQGARRAREADNRHRRESLLLRPAKPMAAR